MWGLGGGEKTSLASAVWLTSWSRCHGALLALHKSMTMTMDYLRPRQNSFAVIYREMLVDKKDPTQQMWKLPTYYQQALRKPGEVNNVSIVTPEVCFHTGISAQDKKETGTANP